MPPIYHNHPDLEQPQVPAVLGTPKRPALELIATLWTAVCVLHFSANTFTPDIPHVYTAQLSQVCSAGLEELWSALLLLRIVGGPGLGSRSSRAFL